jgi:hypothetical protein
MNILLNIKVVHEAFDVIRMSDNAVASRRFAAVASSAQIECQKGVTLRNQCRDLKKIRKLLEGLKEMKNAKLSTMYHVDQKYMYL